MSDKPKTDALREVIVGQYKEDELTGNGMGNILAALTDIETLERERDEARSDLEFRRDLFQLQEKQLNEVRVERAALQEQLDAAIMLGKMQERRHQRDLEELIAAAKAVIDRWETPFWKEAAHTGAYIAKLRKVENGIETLLPDEFKEL